MSGSGEWACFQGVVDRGSVYGRACGWVGKLACQNQVCGRAWQGVAH